MTKEQYNKITERIDFKIARNEKLLANFIEKNISDEKCKQVTMRLDRFKSRKAKLIENHSKNLE